MRSTSVDFVPVFFDAGHPSCRISVKLNIFSKAIVITSTTAYLRQNMGENRTSNVKISSLPSIIAKHSMILPVFVIPA